MKMLLSTEVNLSPGHFVLDGVLVLRKSGTAAPPSFRPISIFSVFSCFK